MCPKAGEVKTLPKAKMLRDGKRKVGTPTENDNTDRKSQVENLAGRKMVGPGGLEPLTSSVSRKRSNQLSYGPIAYGVTSATQTIRSEERRVGREYISQTTARPEQARETRTDTRAASPE